MLYSSDFDTFVNEILWWDRGPREAVDRTFFLCFLLARGTDEAVKHAKHAFGFRDEDFRDALLHAPAGVFLTGESWQSACMAYGIVPPLPLPAKKWLVSTK